MTTYFDESYTHENIDTECAIVIQGGKVKDGIEPPHPVSIRKIEQIPQEAFTIVADNFHLKPGGLTPAYEALGTWIESNGYQIAGPVRELFHGRPENGALTAEIQFPVTKLRASIS